MPRSWTYKSPDAIGQPKRHVYRGPSTAKEYHPQRIMRLQAAFARAAAPKRKSGGGRRRRYQPRYRARPKFSKPKR
jgi:hypothetical protein